MNTIKNQTIWDLIKQLLTSIINLIEKILRRDINKLKKRIKELETAIKKHRSATGNDMCWENDEELWLVLKDNIKINHTPPDWCEFIQKCAKYRESKEIK